MSIGEDAAEGRWWRIATMSKERLKDEEAEQHRGATETDTSTGSSIVSQVLHAIVVAPQVLRRAAGAAAFAFLAKLGLTQLSLGPFFYEYALIFAAATAVGFGIKAAAATAFGRLLLLLLGGLILIGCCYCLWVLLSFSAALGQAASTVRM